MKTDLFESCGHCWVFQICWHIDWSTFTASSFRIWNSSTGIPSPPLALFVVMLLKAQLTSHSRMSGSRWVTTPLWLSGSWRSLANHFSILALRTLWINHLYYLSKWIIPLYQEVTWFFKSHQTWVLLETAQCVYGRAFVPSVSALNFQSFLFFIFLTSKSLFTYFLFRFICYHPKFHVIKELV